MKLFYLFLIFSLLALNFICIQAAIDDPCTTDDECDADANEICDGDNCILDDVEPEEDPKKFKFKVTIRRRYRRNNVRPGNRVRLGSNDNFNNNRGPNVVVLDPIYIRRPVNRG